LDTEDPVYLAAGVRSYPQQSPDRYQVFIEHMVPDVDDSVCGREGGLRSGEQRRVPYDANAPRIESSSSGEDGMYSVNALPRDNRHAGWGEHEQAHSTRARSDYMESRLVFLKALQTAVQEEIRLNEEEGDRSDSGFELYVAASEVPSPDLSVTLDSMSTMTPSTLSRTPGPSISVAINRATPNRIDFTPSRKRAPTGELHRAPPRGPSPDELHDNYGQCPNCEEFHYEDEPC
jgi:hypothetical protein